MAKAQRDKGARFEREIKNELLRFGFSTARRTGEWHAHDILVAVDGHDRIIECKVRAKGFSSLYQFLDKAWAVAHKADFKEPLITLRLGDFLRLSCPLEETPCQNVSPK